MNSSNAVYKVIENDGATASTVEPTSTSNSIFETSDGYRWKYMYSLTSSEALNFATTIRSILINPLDPSAPISTIGQLEERLTTTK